MPEFGLGAIKSPPDERDFSIERLYALTGKPKAIAIPATYAVSPLPAVLDQGSTPQCVAYSSGGMKLFEDGPWPLDENTFFIEIGGGPGGAVVRNAFVELLSTGYPPDAANHKISAYYAVPVDQAEIQAAIMAFGPLVFGMSWYNSWFSPVNGVLPAPDYVVGGHAILAIGWDSRGLRFRNSWGTRWGLGGDCYMPWSMVSGAWEAWKAIDAIGGNMAFTPTGNPTGVARVGTDSNIRGIRADNVLVPLPLGDDVPFYGETTINGYAIDGTSTSAVYTLGKASDGVLVYLLKRNATLMPIGVGPSSFTIAGTVSGTSATVTWK